MLFVHFLESFYNIIENKLNRGYKIVIIPYGNRAHQLMNSLHLSKQPPRHLTEGSIVI